MFALLDIIQQKRRCLHRCRVLLHAMDALATGMRRYIDFAHHYVRQYCHADTNMHLASLRLDQALPKYRCQIRCQRTTNDLRTLRMKVCMSVSPEIIPLRRINLSSIFSHEQQQFIARNFSVFIRSFSCQNERPEANAE